MIFLTGGTGLLGMRMAFDLLRRGEQLRLLKRKNSDLGLFAKVIDFYHGSDSTELRSKIDWVDGDILDSDTLRESLSGCECCIHAAAMVSFHPKDREVMHKVNIEGTANVVNACLDHGSVRLLYVSSVAALGRTEDSGLINENSLWKDSPYNSAYAISKYHAEMEVWRGIEEGLDAVMVNPSIILGAGAKHRSSGTIFSIVEKGLPFYSDGGASVVDARDVSKIALMLLDGETSADRFILNAKSLPYKELFSQIAEKMSKRAPHIHIGPIVLGIVWRVSALKDFIFGTRSAVTSETALSSNCSYRYESDKVKDLLGVDFYNVEQSIDYYVPFYST